MLAEDVALLRALMKAKGLSISVDVQLSHFVFVDARMVSTAVRNIIGMPSNHPLPAKASV